MTQLPRFDLRPGITEPVVLLVSRRAVDAGDVASIASKLKPMLANREDAWRYRGQMTLIIDGYDNDARELVDILEVRVFLRNLDQVWPYWAYFFNQVDDTIKLYLSCLCGAAFPGGGAVELDTQKLQEVLMDGFTAMNGIFERFGFPEDELETHSRGVIEVLEQAGMS
ncbi:MAG: hypothetical protein ABI606_22715 [Rhodoferax sp.]